MFNKLEGQAKRGFWGKVDQYTNIENTIALAFFGCISAAFICIYGMIDNPINWWLYVATLAIIIVFAIINFFGFMIYKSWKVSYAAEVEQNDILKISGQLATTLNTMNGLKKDDNKERAKQVDELRQLLNMEDCDCGKVDDPQNVVTGLEQFVPDQTDDQAPDADHPISE